VALNPETIQQLHHTLRALPRPLLESLFRQRFEVPDTAVTIADRINQKCHHDWIRAFLVPHREVRSVEPHREVRSVEPHREVRSVEPHREVRSVEPHREVRSAEQHQRPGDR
jgi:hypothetical protein